MFSKKLTIFIFVLLLIPFSGSAQGLELESRYATIVYDNATVLKKFNSKLYMGKLKYLLHGKKNETVEDEVLNKIDVIVEKIQLVLSMFPDDMNFKIVIHESKEGVRKDYKRIYNHDRDVIAFYAPIEDTVFIWVKRSNLDVVSHEIGHVVAEKYFSPSPPSSIHEVIAQHAQMHIMD